MTVITTLTEEKLGKERFKFLTAALSKDMLKPYLCVVQYDAEQKRLWATDGRRLHAVNNIALGKKPLFGEVSGKTILFYDIEKDTSKKGPAYEKVVPDTAEMVESPKEVLFSEKKKYKFDSIFTVFYIQSRAPIQMSYVRDLKGFDFKVFWFEKDTSTRPWLFKDTDNTVFAVIMPMNIEDYWR